MPTSPSQGSACSDSLGKLIHRLRDTAETHCEQAGDPHNYGQEEAQVNALAAETGSGLILPGKIKKNVSGVSLLKRAANETFLHFYPMRSISYLRVKWRMDLGCQGEASVLSNNQGKLCLVMTSGSFFNLDSFQAPRV